MSQEFTNQVIDHARPITGGKSWQWTKLTALWADEASSSEGLTEAVDQIRAEHGFDPLPESE